MSVKTAIKDGYYNSIEHLDEPRCWRVEGGNVFFVYDDGTERRSSMTLSLLATKHYGPSVWLPPGVTENPAAEPAPVRDGYYNYAEYPRSAGCWLIRGIEELFVNVHGREHPTATNVSKRVRDGRFVPSQWLPPGVTHNPALVEPPNVFGPFKFSDSNPPPAVEPEPVPTIDDAYEAKMFVLGAAVNVIALIAEQTTQSGESVRAVFPRPSLLDRAIAQRVIELLT